MADVIDTDDNRQLPTFSTLKKPYQLAIMLKAEGHKYSQIINQIKVDLDLDYKESTLRDWFMAGGLLEQGYQEYQDYLADESVKEAKLHIKRLSSKASQVLEDLMDDKDTADNIRERAARTVLNKYIPDRQIIVDENKKDDLPGAIAAAGEDILKNDPPADTPKEDADLPAAIKPEGNENAAAEPADTPKD